MFQPRCRSTCSLANEVWAVHDQDSAFETHQISRDHDFTMHCAGAKIDKGRGCPAKGMASLRFAISERKGGEWATNGARSTNIRVC